MIVIVTKVILLPHILPDICFVFFVGLCEVELAVYITETGISILCECILTSHLYPEVLSTLEVIIVRLTAEPYSVHHFKNNARILHSEQNGVM